MNDAYFRHFTHTVCGTEYMYTVSSCAALEGFRLRPAAMYVHGYTEDGL